MRIPGLEQAAHQFLPKGPHRLHHFGVVPPTAACLQLSVEQIRITKDIPAASILLPVVLRVDRSDEQVRDQGDHQQSCHHEHRRVVNRTRGINRAGRCNFHQPGKRDRFTSYERLDLRHRGTKDVLKTCGVDRGHEIAYRRADRSRAEPSNTPGTEHPSHAPGSQQSPVNAAYKTGTEQVGQVGGNRGKPTPVKVKISMTAA